MRECEALAVPLEDARFDGQLGGRAVAARHERGVDHPHGGTRERGCDQRCRMRLRLKHSEPAADELLEVRGYGQLLAGVEGLAPLEQRPADLEGEEEIAPGYAAHALQGPA